MRILFILDAIPADQVGGIAKSVATEMAELESRGHEVRVLTRQQLPSTPEKEIIDGVSVERMRAPLRGSRVYYLHPFVTMRRAPKVIERICTEWTPDVAYVHSSFLANGLARADVATAKVFCFHAPAAEEIGIDAAGGKYGALSPLARAAIRTVITAERQALRGMDLTFTRSAFMRDRLVACHPEFAGMEIPSCPIMVDTDRYEFNVDGAPARKRLGLPLDRPIVLCVRRLVNRMGLPELLESIDLLRVTHRDVLLLIAGRGYMQAQLEEKVDQLKLRENVRLLGFVPEEDLPSYFSASTLCVVPSVALEGFGLVSIEAMSAGRVVVATPVGGNVEVVGGLDREFLTAGSSPSELAAGIATWIARAGEPELRRRVRGYCESSFGRASVGAQMESLLAGVVEQRQRRRHAG